MKFPMGQLVATPGALETAERNGINLAVLVHRHVTGDWGDLGARDKKANDAAVEEGTRILSAYTVAGAKLWIITEADRSVTTVLLPEEY